MRLSIISAWLAALIAATLAIPALAAPINFNKGVTLYQGDWLWRLKTSCPVKEYLYLPLVTADFYSRAYIIRHGETELVAIKGPEEHDVSGCKPIFKPLAKSDRSATPGKLSKNFSSLGGEYSEFGVVLPLVPERVVHPADLQAGGQHSTWRSRPAV